MNTLTDTEMLDWLENPLSQRKLFGNFVMGGSQKSLRSAIAFAMVGLIKDDKPRPGDAVAAALHFASENAEMKALLKDLREELKEENQNPFTLSALLDRMVGFIGKEES